MVRANVRRQSNRSQTGLTFSAGSTRLTSHQPTSNGNARSNQPVQAKQIGLKRETERISPIVRHHWPRTPLSNGKEGIRRSTRSAIVRMEAKTPHAHLSSRTK